MKEQQPKKIILKESPEHSLFSIRLTWANSNMQKKYFSKDLQEERKYFQPEWYDIQYRQKGWHAFADFNGFYWLRHMMHNLHEQDKISAAEIYALKIIGLQDGKPIRVYDLHQMRSEIKANLEEGTQK
jgi:hypothetical protein